MRQARFAGAFTFRYSIRPGTPAATMDDQVPAEVVQERYERLTALVEETTYAENQKLAGTTVEVLVAEGEGRKDAATHRMSGRARDNRLVHFTPDQTAPRPGDIVTVTVTRGAPHYLLSDAAPLSVRRTRAGDAWEAAAAAPLRSALPRERCPGEAAAPSCSACRPVIPPGSQTPHATVVRGRPAPSLRRDRAAVEDLTAPDPEGLAALDRADRQNPRTGQPRQCALACSRSAGCSENHSSGFSRWTVAGRPVLRLVWSAGPGR